MDDTKQRISVAGLLLADADTLLVLTQDVLRATLVRIETTTLCELLLLAEAGDATGKTLSGELAHFREQMVRELRDLPDGQELVLWVNELLETDASVVPTILREALVAKIPTLKKPEVVDAVARTVARWEGVAPITHSVPARTAPEARIPKAASASKTPRARAARAPRTPAAQVDERRLEWIKDDVTSRLKRYIPDGLKEQVLVAGCRHRAPWKDMTPQEVVAVLRKLERDGMVRKTAERWIMR